MPTAAAATAATAAAVAENDASAVAARAGSVFAAAHAVVDEGAEDEGACDDEVVGVAVHVLLRLVIVVFVRFEDVAPVAAPAEASEANDGDAGYDQRGDDAVGIHHQPGGDVEDDVDDDHDAQHAAVARATCRGDFPPEPFFDLFRRDAQVAAPGEFLRALFGAEFVVIAAVVAVLQGVARLDVPVERARRAFYPALVVVEFALVERVAAAVKQWPFVQGLCEAPFAVVGLGQPGEAFLRRVEQVFCPAAVFACFCFVYDANQGVAHVVYARFRAKRQGVRFAGGAARAFLP